MHRSSPSLPSVYMPELPQHYATREHYPAPSVHEPYFPPALPHFGTHQFASTPHLSQLAYPPPAPYYADHTQSPSAPFIPSFHGAATYPVAHAPAVLPVLVPFEYPPLGASAPQDLGLPDRPHSSRSFRSPDPPSRPSSTSTTSRQRRPAGMSRRRRGIASQERHSLRPTSPTRGRRVPGVAPSSSHESTRALRPRLDCRCAPLLLRLRRLATTLPSRRCSCRARQPRTNRFWRTLDCWRALKKRGSLKLGQEEAFRRPFGTR